MLSVDTAIGSSFTRRRVEEHKSTFKSHKHVPALPAAADVDESLKQLVRHTLAPVATQRPTATQLVDELSSYFERREERLELGGGTSASAHHEKTRGGGAWVGGNGSGGHRACVRTSSGHRESVRISKPGFRYARAAPKAPGLAI